MAEVINNNVFAADKRFVDLGGLDYFWEKAKAYVDAADDALAARAQALEDTVGDSTKGLVKGLADLKTTVDALGNIEGGEGIGGMIDSKIAALDLPNTYETKGAAATAEQNAKDYADSLATNYDAAGAAATAEQNAKDYADSLATNYDAAGAAATAKSEAIADAKAYVDGIVNDTTSEDGAVTKGLNSRIADLEAIDHAKLASDASAAAVATVLDGAPEKFDTLKEIAQWISDSETADSAADLVTRVGSLETTVGKEADGENPATGLVGRVVALEAIDHDAYKAADETVLTNANTYADGLVKNEDGTVKFDAAGSAAAAEAAAKTYADGKFQVAGNYETAGAAATAEQNAKDYADNKFQVAGNYETAGTAEAKIAALDLPNTYEAKGAAATAQAAAIAQAKADATEALKGYYTKTEVDNLLSTNSTGDRAYAKQYTDELFGSFKFAENSEIDALFA